MRMPLYLQDCVIGDLRGLQGEPHLPEVKARIKSSLIAPSRKGWSALSALHVKGYRTVWQLVCELDSTFPGTGPSSNAETGEILRD